MLLIAVVPIAIGMRANRNNDDGYLDRGVQMYAPTDNECVANILGIGTRFQQEEKGQGALSKGETETELVLRRKSSALEGRGLYPCSASLRDATRTLHAGEKGLLPLLSAPFSPTSSGQVKQLVVLLHKRFYLFYRILL